MDYMVTIECSFEVTAKNRDGVWGLWKKFTEDTILKEKAVEISIVPLTPIAPKITPERPPEAQQGVSKLAVRNNKPKKGRK